MKRVITSQGASSKDKSEKYSLNIEEFLNDAEKYISRNDFRKAIYSLERASDHLKILKHWLKRWIMTTDLSVHDEADEYAELANEYKARIEELKSNLYAAQAWSRLSGADQRAVEIAKQLMSEGKDMKSAAYFACLQVDEGNAEPEYAAEEFYQDETNLAEVLAYLEMQEELW